MDECKVKGSPLLELAQRFGYPNNADLWMAYTLPEFSKNLLCEILSKKNESHAQQQLKELHDQCQWIQNWFRDELLDNQAVSLELKDGFTRDLGTLMEQILDWIEQSIRNGKADRFVFERIKQTWDILFNRLAHFEQGESCRLAKEKQALLQEKEKLQEKTVLASTKHKNEQTISQLIAQGEGYTVEFKETLEYSVRENKQDTNLNKECLKTIAAFLNTEGGTLLIGVRDNGEITGIERDLPYVQRKNEDGFELKLRDLIKSNFTPFPSGKVHIHFENFTKETVCRVDVEPVNKNQTIHLGKDVYIRDGNTKRKLEGRDLTDWIQQRGK